MERATTLTRLGRNAARRLGWAAALLGTCAVGYSCAGARPAARVPELPPPRVSALSPTSAPAGASSAPEPLSLAGFQPLLADPRYEAARLKQEAGDYGAAADLARAAQVKSPPPPGEIDRHRFLLARLLERAGRIPEARDAFLSVSPASLLAPYAELGAGRMELSLGFADRALLHVGRARWRCANTAVCSKPLPTTASARRRRCRCSAP